MFIRPSAIGVLSAILALVAALPGCSPTPSTSGVTPAGDYPENNSADSAPATGVSSSSPIAASSEDVQLVVADLGQLEQVIASHAGKVVVIDIWSTSCAPCMREFPHLVELSQTHPERMVCVSLNVDYIGLKSKPPEAYTAKVEQFLQKQQAMDVTNLLSASTDEAVLRHFKIGAIPAILIYSVDGELKYTLTDSNTGEDGLTYEGDVLPKVRELLPTL